MVPPDHALAVSDLCFLVVERIRLAAKCRNLQTTFTSVGHDRKLSAKFLKTMHPLRGNGTNHRDSVVVEVSEDACGAEWDRLFTTSGQMPFLPTWRTDVFLSWRLIPAEKTVLSVSQRPFAPGISSF